MIFLNRDMTYEEAKKLTPHFTAIGIDRVRIISGDGMFPWHLATNCKPGGMSRFGVSVGLEFTFTKLGISYEWDLDVEPRDANGTPELQLNSEGISAVLAMVKRKVADQIRAHLVTCANDIQKRTNEIFEAANKSALSAAAFRDMARVTTDETEDSSAT